MGPWNPTCRETSDMWGTLYLRSGQFELICAIAIVIWLVSIAFCTVLSKPSLLRVQERDCVLHRSEGSALNIAPQQISEFGTKLTIHSVSVPQFAAPTNGKWGWGTALTNGCFYMQLL